MARRYLTLGPPEDVIKAFVLSPLAAIATLWLFFAIANAVTFHLGILADLFILPVLLLFGAVFSGVLEVVVALPLVIGLRSYGWRWVNWGTLAAVGFFTGALPTAWVVATSPAGVALLSEPGTLAWVTAFGIAGVAGAVTFGWIAATPGAG